MRLRIEVVCRRREVEVLLAKNKGRDGTSIELVGDVEKAVDEGLKVG